MGPNGSDARAGEDTTARGSGSADAGSTEFGRYRLWGMLGRGGMGEVYRAYDTGRDRVVALKLLPPQLANDADFTARFRRESRLAARLNDPHVVPIHDFGEVDGRLFIDMRLVEGTDLAALVAAGHRLDPARAAYVVGQVAAALDAAHREGLVHRDVKPSNVLLTPDDHVYLTDFGIAHSTDATALTGTGTALGTIHYMAPERFLHGRGDRRMDVYSLGCLLHEVLTGRRPFEGDEVAAQMYAHVHLPPPRPSQLAPGIPAAFDDVVARAMAKDPAHRFDTAGALAAAARAAAAGPVHATGPAGTIRASAPGPHHGAAGSGPVPYGPYAPTAAGPVPPGPVPPGQIPPGQIPPGSAPAGLYPSGSGASGPARDPWRRRALLASGVAVAALVAAAVAIGTALHTGTATDDRAAGAPTTAAARPGVLPVLPGSVPTAGADAPATDPAGATGTHVKIGEPVREGGIEVTVTAARYADSVDVGNKYSGFTPTPAGAGAKYVVVQAKILNDTTESISPGCGLGLRTAVLDDRARRFDTITETSQLKGNESACFPATQPGFSVDVTWAYKVPATANVTLFAFHDQQTYTQPDRSAPGVDLALPGA